MGRGKKRATQARSPIALSDVRERRVPSPLGDSLLKEALGESLAGERVKLIKTKGRAEGVKRGTHGLVQAHSKTALLVAWDDGRETTLHPGLDAYEVITSAEIEARRTLLQKSRISAGTRVLVETVRSPAARAAVKREWRGRVATITPDGRVAVEFDKGPQLTLDPRVDRLRNVTGEETTAADLKALVRLQAGKGMRLRLKAALPDAPERLYAGKTGTISRIDDGLALQMDWDDGSTALNLVPHRDEDLIEVLEPAPTPFSEAAYWEYRRRF
jgi:hypothetical protein